MDNNYQRFIESKKRKFISSGFEIAEHDLSSHLFDFQKHAVKTSIKKGRYALFFDCGLGKTLMQLEFAIRVHKKHNKPVLILAPLAVVEQTIKEAKKFGLSCSHYEQGLNGIMITNYDQLKNIDTSEFVGVVLDESSILKGQGRKTSSMIINKFKNTPYKLACTATPSPNDHMELGQHSEFLGAMSYLEMLAMYFVHDGGQTSKWRLRKHAENDFWRYVSTWSMSMDRPQTLGFDVCGYDLPEINYIEHIIPVENNTMSLFADVAVSATDLNKDLKRTREERLLKTAELVNSSDEQWIVWGLQNAETNELTKLINNSVNVRGSDSAEHKAKHLNGFANGDFKCLITKTSIASFGMNYQNCHNMVFASYDFKFEQFYQAVRRCYRFGQKHPVNVHIMIPESQMNVRKSILKKQSNHFKMIEKMSQFSNKVLKEQEYNKSEISASIYENENCKVINGDCVQEVSKLPSNSVDLSIFSPPFADLYVYSDLPEDMGNVKDYEEFEAHFKFLIPELKRVIKPGRICAVHCMDLPIQKGKEGFIGLRDFSGILVDWFTKEGFIYHSRSTIWKNPVTEMQRTKALGLLHKTIKKDASMSRVGIPDYILYFRNEGKNEIPVKHQDKDPYKPNYLPVDLWQKYASPIWYDVDYSRTLQYRSARDKNDEKHICPLQLDTIERIIHLYSNEGETVLSPFGGIGSEGYQAIKMKRKSISIELKKSYFAQNVRNHKAATLETNQIKELFDA